MEKLISENDIEITGKNSVDPVLEMFVKSLEIETIDDGFFPESRAYFIADIHHKENQIFFHGGANKKKEYSQIDIFDISNMNWRSIAEISTVNPFFIFDKALSGHTSNIILIDGNEKIFSYGGYDGKNYTNAIYLIELDDYSFTQVDVRGKSGTEYPLARSYHTCNYDKSHNALYVFGGWNGNLTAVHKENFQSLWRFDIKCNNIIVKIFLALSWEKIVFHRSTISLRGHTANYVKDSDMKEANGNGLILMGGVSGFNKYSDKIYIICLKVLISFLFL